MSIEEQIKALPEWPALPSLTLKPSADIEIAWLDDSLTAALARLALAREWIEYAHQIDCRLFPDENGRTGDRCTCGRNVLLAALEQPK